MKNTYEFCSIELVHPACIPHKHISKQRVNDILNSPIPYITGVEIFCGLVFLECNMYNIFLKLQLNQNLEQVYIEAATGVTKADADSHVSRKSR